MGYDRIVYIRYHFSCGLDRKDACWLSFTPLTGINTNIARFLQEPGKGEPAVLAPADGVKDFWLVGDLKNGCANIDPTW